MQRFSLAFGERVAFPAKLRAADSFPNYLPEYLTANRTKNAFASLKFCLFL
jgi:hypothetical protein